MDGHFALDDDVVAQMRHDPAEVEVPPLSLTMAVDSVHLPPTVSAARDPLPRRDIDDDAILVELEAGDAGALEGKEDSEYTLLRASGVRSFPPVSG